MIFKHDFSIAILATSQLCDIEPLGTLHILEAVRELKLSSRIIIAGSSTVYGASTEEWDGPVPEEASMKPVSPYGVSKAATEMHLLKFVLNIVRFDEF